MRSPFVAASILALLLPFGTVGQKKQEPQVKIICPPVLHPRLALQVRPKYPKEAKQSGIEGRVSLHCIVRADGSVGEIEVIRGEEPFVQAAKTAVAQWRYKPIVLNGVAVESDTTVDVIFELPRQKSNRSKSSDPHNAPQD